MVSILKAGEKDAALLASLAKTTFIESHGNSASKDDISFYVTEKYTESVLKDELNDSVNHYYIIYSDEQPAGFSKIVFNIPTGINGYQDTAKLERLYLLHEFYDLKIGAALLQFNIQLSKEHHQKGIWLYVWTENTRAVKFYLKAGFRIIGSYDFKLSETHSNPNHQMLLEI